MYNELISMKEDGSMTTNEEFRRICLHIELVDVIENKKNHPGVDFLSEHHRRTKREREKKASLRQQTTRMDCRHKISHIQVRNIRWIFSLSLSSIFIKQQMALRRR